MMWSLGMVLNTIEISLAVAEWFSSEEKRTKKVDAQIAADMESEQSSQ
jgi:hypothetical protein